MAREKVNDDLICELREQLQELRSQHEKLLHETEEVSPGISELYHLIWDPEEQLITEFNTVRDCIKFADSLTYVPKK